MRLKFILIAVIILVIGGASIFIFYGWFLNKQARVLTGTARPNFPFSDYSSEELNKMYPQTANENVKTTQTPEETYNKFRTALKSGNLDEAVKCCFRTGDQIKMKRGLQEIKNGGQLDSMIRDLGDLRKESEYGSKATYSYSTIKDGKSFGHTITFTKNNDGVWLIESL